MFEVTKEFNFEAAHCLDQHKGKCKNLHGHNYKVFVTMRADALNEMDMVHDFYDLNTFAKPLFDYFDHSFMYNARARDPFEHEIASVCMKYGRKLTVLPMRFTAENMAKYFYNSLQDSLSTNFNNKITISKVTVYETPTSFATYSKEDKNANK